jgi:hypothetical protein
MQDDAIDIVLHRILAAVVSRRLQRFLVCMLRAGIGVDQPLRAAPGDGFSFARGWRQRQKPCHRDIAAII